jgi:hypothetical protein
VTTVDQNDDALARALRQLAEEESGIGASWSVEAALREEVRALTPKRPFTVLTYLSAAAAVVLFALVWRVVPSQPPHRIAAVEPAAPDTLGFLPLAYAHVPAASGHIVRMEVPATVLASFGLENADPELKTVTADVFVGDDGLARAVRFPSLSAEHRQ